MVRLVFRRYTQIRRSICTSEPLRASTSVSAGFALFRHSSPSFGSQQVRSNANLPKSRTGRSVMQLCDELHTSAHKSAHLLSLRPWVSVTLRLAHMLDSLVRVSRRVGWGRLAVNVLSASCRFRSPLRPSELVTHRRRRPFSIMNGRATRLQPALGREARAATGHSPRGVVCTKGLPIPQKGDLPSSRPFDSQGTDVDAHVTEVHHALPTSHKMRLERSRSASVSWEARD